MASSTSRAVLLPSGGMPSPCSSSLLLRSSASSIALARFSRSSLRNGGENATFLIRRSEVFGGAALFRLRAASPWRAISSRDFAAARAKKNADGHNGAVDGNTSVASGDRNIVPVELHKEASDSYLSYAMSVIVGRALPDVRDGLKPVHRRILFAMHGLGLNSKKPFKKCARVVGEVLGKYHPHGDTAVYDALVRMAQGFSLRSPLISGHGNFGSLDGDPAAAMRYTECRLDPLSEAMFLSDLDSETVDFAPSFDGSTNEPIVLPARLPNVLINGASGIAVGMATNIPPHNLSEVVDALCALIRNPNATIQELMEHMPGPDFPTGGHILGTSGVLDAYRSGRGQITVRGAVEVEEGEGGKQTRIVIKEIPYAINKAALVSKIADLVNNKTLDGVSDVRDESDRSGMRVVVELRKGVLPEVVLNNLYKHTTLQTRFSCNMVGILDKQPQMFGVKELLQNFLNFRCSVVERRTKYELQRAEERDHLLQGFLIGLEKLDDVVQVLKHAKDVSSAIERLQQDFGLSVAQAEGILAMPLRRITSLERGKIEDEHNALLSRVKDLQAILSSKQRVLQIVEDEALLLKKEFGTPRRTQLAEEDAQISDMDVIANDETLLTLSEKGYVKRMFPDTFSAQRRGTIGKSGGKLKVNDGVADSFICKAHDHVLFFSEKGVVYSLRAYQIPESSRTSSGIPITQVLSVPAGERITSMFPLSEFKEDQYLVMLTADGYIKRTPISAFASIRSQGIVAIQLLPGDELKWVRQATEADNIFIGSQRGYVVQVPCAFRALKRSARGVRAMNLKAGDKLAAIDIVPGTAMIESENEGSAGGPPWLMLVSENGIAKRVPVEAFPYNGLNRVGVIGCKFTPGDRLASMFVVGRALAMDGESNEELVVASLGGMFNRFKVRDVRTLSRMARGIRLMKIDATDKVKSVTLVPSSDEHLVEDDDSS